MQTSLGPYGRNKIVINHLQKMILTSDAATILRELDVVHPAAKLLVMASQQQDSEMGDGTNLVIVLAGELLKKAEELIRLGLKTSDIVSGYEKAQNYALKVLEGMFLTFGIRGNIGYTVTDYFFLCDQISRSTVCRTCAQHRSSARLFAQSWLASSLAPRIFWLVW